MNQSSVDTAVVEDTAFVTISGPANKNALSRSVHHLLGEQLDLLQDRADIRFVVVRGANGLFSSGGDLDELGSGLPDNYVEDYWRRMEKTVLKIGQLDQIVIAAIEGAAIGAGAALALAADIVVAESVARMRFSFVHLGLVPDAGCTWLLPQNAGFAVARDILLTGRWVTMDEANRLGLVSRVVEPGCIDAEVAGLLAELRKAPRETLALTKNLINGPSRDAMTAAVRAEGATQDIAAATVDSIELVSQIHERIKSPQG